MEGGETRGGKEGEKRKHKKQELQMTSLDPYRELQPVLFLLLVVTSSGGLFLPKVARLNDVCHMHLQ